MLTHAPLSLYALQYRCDIHAEVPGQDEQVRSRDRVPESDTGLTWLLHARSAPRPAPPGPAPKLQMSLPPPPPRLVPPVPPPKPASATFPAAPRPAAADTFGLAALSAPPLPPAVPLAAPAYASAPVSQPPAAAPPNLLDTLFDAPVAGSRVAPGIGQSLGAAPNMAGYGAFPAPVAAPVAAPAVAVDPFDLLMSSVAPPVAAPRAYGMPSVPPAAAPFTSAAPVDPFLSFPPPPVVQHAAASAFTPLAPVDASASVGRSSGGLPLGTPTQARKPATLDEAMSASLNLLA